MQSLAVRTTTIGPVCPKCGTIAKSGKTSCCGRGGSWFRNCGGAGNTKLKHTWYEGIHGCKSRGRSKTVMGHQLNVAQQNIHDYSNNADTAINPKAAVMSRSTFVFASTPVNKSTPVSETAQIWITSASIRTPIDFMTSAARVPSDTSPEYSANRRNRPLQLIFIPLPLGMWIFVFNLI